MTQAPVVRNTDVSNGMISIILIVTIESDTSNQGKETERIYRSVSFPCKATKDLGGWATSVSRTGCIKLFPFRLHGIQNRMVKGNGQVFWTVLISG
jgi:hypothetical protein